MLESEHEIKAIETALNIHQRSLIVIKSKRAKFIVNLIKDFVFTRSVLNSSKANEEMKIFFIVQEQNLNENFEKIIQRQNCGDSKSKNLLRNFLFLLLKTMFNFFELNSDDAKLQIKYMSIYFEALKDSKYLDEKFTAFLQEKNPASDQTDLSIFDGNIEILNEQENCTNDDSEKNKSVYVERNANQDKELIKFLSKT